MLALHSTFKKIGKTIQKYDKNNIIHMKLKRIEEVEPKINELLSSLAPEEQERINSIVDTSLEEITIFTKLIGIVPKSERAAIIGAIFSFPEELLQMLQEKGENH